MKRTPLKRGTTELKRTPIKRTAMKRHRSASNLRSRNNKIPSSVRKAVVERSQARCEATYIIHDCAYIAVHMHHILLRSLGGKHTVDNLLHVCAPAHEAIHAKPAVSYELGYLRHSWEAQ